MKTFCFLPFLLIVSFVSGQNIKAEISFRKGKAAYETKDCEKAISFFQKSIKNEGPDSAYYYLGKAQFVSGDSCAACNSLLNAKIRGISEAKKLYTEKCVTTDTIFYSGGLYYSVVTKRICPNEIEAAFYKKSNITGKDTMVFLKNDSAINDFSFNSPEFDIKKNIDKIDPGIVDKAPEFPGGEAELFNFLRNNVKYPQYAREKNIQGTVFIQFVVRKNGNLSLIRVLNEVGGGLDEEAEKVVRAMPNWISGKKDGKPVNVIFVLPIRFILQG